jgi:hypothetical protein
LRNATLAGDALPKEETECKVVSWKGVTVADWKIPEGWLENWFLLESDLSSTPGYFVDSLFNL